MNKNMNIVFLVTTLLVVNALLNCSPINLLITIPQFVYVLHLVQKKKYEQAVYFHLIFIATSFSYNLSENALDSLGVDSLTSYNYSKFKIASIPLFFINTVVILVVLNKNKYCISNQARKSDFYKFYIFLKYTFISGAILGFIGLLCFGYFLEGFITYGSYAFFLLVTAYMLLLLYNSELSKKLYEAIPILLIVSIIVLVLLEFGGLPYIGSAYITYFSALLLPYSLYEKRVVVPIITLLIYMVFNLIIGTGGKTIIHFIMIFIAVFFITFNKKIPVSLRKIKKYRMFYYMLIVLLPICGIYILSNAMGDRESNFMYKLHNVQTMFGFVFGLNGIYGIDRSPYIRIAEFLNIMYEDLYNPFYLLFGRGFGGYYEDVLGLFNAVDISYSTFSNEQIIAKKYYTAHDAFVSIPMINGIIGMYLWIKTILSYMKNVYKNYLKLIVLPFLLLIYYFDSLIGLIGTMFMFASEYNIVNDLNKFKLFNTNK